MTKSEHDDKAPSARDREATVGILIEHFSRDALGLDEFEQRIDASRAAHTKSALDSLTEDLRTDEAYPPIEESAGETPPSRAYQVATGSDIKETELTHYGNGRGEPQRAAQLSKKKHSFDSHGWHRIGSTGLCFSARHQRDPSFLSNGGSGDFSPPRCQL